VIKLQKTGLFVQSSVIAVNCAHLISLRVMDGKNLKPLSGGHLPLFFDALGKSSYGFIAKLFGVTPAAVQKWLS